MNPGDLNAPHMRTQINNVLPPEPCAQNLSHLRLRCDAIAAHEDVMVTISDAFTVFSVFTTRVSGKAR